MLHYGSISRGVTKGQGGAITRARNHSGGTEILKGHQMIAGAPKNPNNVTRTFFNAIHLLPEDLRFENGGCQTCFLPRAQSNLVTPLRVIQYSSALSMYMK